MLLTQKFGGKLSIYKYQMVWEKIFVALDIFFSYSDVILNTCCVPNLLFLLPPSDFFGKYIVWISYILSDPCNLIHSIRFIFSAIITNIMQLIILKSLICSFSNLFLFGESSNFLFTNTQKKIK